MIDGGDMSSCWADEIWGKKLPQGEYAPEYYSERGEDCPPRYDDDIFDFLKKENNEEYAYIWTVNNKWVAFDMNEFNDNDPEKVEIPAGNPYCLIIMTEQERIMYQELAQEFWVQIEKEAAELEVTVDYYLEEFYCS